MAHVFMGIIVLGLALTLISGAIVAPPILRFVNIGRHVRCAFSVMLITLGAYLASVSRLFFQNRLGPHNYAPELYGVRILAFLAAAWFVANMAVCSHRIAKHQNRRTFFVREGPPRKRKW
jgi:hypothetical protein